MTSFASRIPHPVFSTAHWVKHNPAVGYISFALSGLLLAAAPYREGMVLPYSAAGVIAILCFLFTLTLRRVLFSSRTASGGWRWVKYFGIAMLKTWGAKRTLSHAPIGLLVAIGAIATFEYATTGVDYIGLLLRGDITTQESIKAFIVSLFGFYGVSASLGILLGIGMLVLTIPKYRMQKT
jgi:hypothetical protein